METRSQARPPRRRSQAERRASTRTALLDATIACVVERGYAGARMAEIETRAGVSRGARLHHYADKAELMSAAVAHLFERLAEDFEAGMAAHPPGGEDEAVRFRAGYRLLWSHHEHPAQAAVLDLFAAARTDPELRRALAEGTAGMGRRAREVAARVFPNLARRELNGLLESIQALMTGVALRRGVYGETPRDEQVLALFEDLITQRFVKPPGAAR
ncbi:MAG: TetR family transcriptional regulator [Proteobacteria bacterium]|nr:TetR family transcriptional regulator [Pseudomonadota bacterium]